MKQQLADLAIDASQKLNGFKVLGVFPFYLKFIKVGTHIKLCKIKEQLKEASPDDPNIKDFYSHDTQQKIVPLISEYLLTALLNERLFSPIIRPFLKRKLKSCGHYHFLSLYAVIKQLDEPAFFLSYWKGMRMEESTLLRAAAPSSENSSSTKKKPG